MGNTEQDHLKWEIRKTLLWKPLMSLPSALPALLFPWKTPHRKPIDHIYLITDKLQLLFLLAAHLNYISPQLLLMDSIVPPQFV